MKQNLLRCYIASFICAMLLSSTVAIHADTWSGTNPPVSETADFTIDGSLGNVIFPLGCTTVDATSNNIAVTVTDNPTLQGNTEGPSQLVLSGNAGNSITFNLTASNLTFLGSNDGDQDPLLIYLLPGNYEVIFNVVGGYSVSFTSDTAGGYGGTQVWLELTNGIPAVSETLEFQLSGATNTAAQINIGPLSLMSFTSADMNQGDENYNGEIAFNGSNAIGDTGRLVLNISDTGGVIVWPHYVSPYSSNPGSCPLLDNIYTASLSAGAALFFVYSANDYNDQSSLLVVNYNKHLFDLLSDPFFNLDTRGDSPEYGGSFSGIQYGFVLGANGQLAVGEESFFDYVGASTNICPMDLVPGFTTINPTQLLKARNPSAFFVDGSNNPNAQPAQILQYTDSAIFFRSGVDNVGNVNNNLADPYVFTINPFLRTPADTTCSESFGPGQIVFDVEGLLNVYGSNTDVIPLGCCPSDNLQTKIELLSRHVWPTGGPLFYNTQQDIFPIRSFAYMYDGLPYQYNNAAFLINNRMNLYDTTLVHTDLNHRIFQDNDIKSEPAYIGGETFTLTNTTIGCIPRPKIAFINSALLVHSSVAFTGVDLDIPNEYDIVGTTTECYSNLSQFRFFGNGRCIDNGSGRNMILGTLAGSQACDGCTIISDDAHLDIIQETDCYDLTITITQKLILDVASNTTVINNEVPPFPTCIDNQYSIQTIYLGHASNISIGTNSCPECVTGFLNDTHPELLIAGNFFSFETRGGPNSLPETSNVTGKGGIFVDQNGTISIAEWCRAFMGTMVTKSCNGIINLPQNQVLFASRVGEAEWQLNLNDASQVIIISAGKEISNYTLNWIDTRKNCVDFCPYVVTNVYECSCPPVPVNTVDNIPIVLGTVQQLQIATSRLGDEAHIRVGDGGWVRELVFLTGYDSAEAPVAVMVVDDNAELGLGSANRNPDSLDANITLGVNGVILIANGNGVIDLNEDIIVNNVCSIVKGPDFVDTGTFRLQAEVPHTMRVTQDGILDLTSFGSLDSVEIGGQIEMILEPGAQIIMGGCTLRFTDQASMVGQPVLTADELFSSTLGADVTITDPFRVRFIGTGIIQFTDQSSFQVKQDVFVGVETLFEYDARLSQTCEIPVTDLTFLVQDSASMILGSPGDVFGGTFQIGNTTNLLNHSVTCIFQLAGLDAQIQIKAGGFMGWAVGIANKGSALPNNWLVNNLFNVNEVAVVLQDGVFIHDRIFPGNDTNASLLALGYNNGLGATTPTYSIVYPEDIDVEVERSNHLTLWGGGNIALITTSTAGPIYPTVLTTDGVINSRLSVGMLAGYELLPQQEPDGLTGLNMFQQIKTLDISTPGRCLGLANAASAAVFFRQTRSPINVGYVDRGTLGRAQIFNIADIAGGSAGERRTRATELGAVNLAIYTNQPPPGAVRTASQIQ